jgi:perosamine synthetase
LAARYRAALVGHWAVDVQVVDPAADPAWHLFVVQLRLDRLREDRGEVYRAMRAEGIGVNVHYIPVHRHPFYRGRYPDLEGRLPVAEGAYERLLTLPLFSAMTDADLDDTVAALDKVAEAFRAG